MSEWALSLTKNAENDFGKLDHESRKRIFQKLETLAENFDALHHVPLAGPWQGFFKLRIGDWRVIYAIDYKKLLLVVYVMGRRDKIYKSRRG